MRRNAIARIIIYSILVIVLSGILLAGLGIKMYTFDLDSGFEVHTTGDNSPVPISVDSVRNIDIEWASGEIQIITSNSDEIQFTESGKSIEQNQLIWRLDGDTLKIAFSHNDNFIHIGNNISKNLTVTLPEDWTCNDLSIEAASADMVINKVRANKVEIETASGECEFVDCNIGHLDVDTASGDILFNGWLTSLDCDAASANFKGLLKNTPERIQMSSASGDLELTLPAGANFRVDMDALSGKLNTDFEGHYSNGAFLVGDGSCEISFDGLSGSIKINEAK